MNFQGLQVCARCDGQGIHSDGTTCNECKSGVVGPLEHHFRRWAEYFRCNLDAAIPYEAAGFEPSMAHAAAEFGWPAEKGPADMEVMRAHGLRSLEVKVELRRLKQRRLV